MRTTRAVMLSPCLDSAFRVPERHVQPRGHAKSAADTFVGKPAPAFCDHRGRDTLGHQHHSLSKNLEALDQGLDLVEIRIRRHDEFECRGCLLGEPSQWSTA